MDGDDLDFINLREKKIDGGFTSGVLYCFGETDDQGILFKILAMSKSDAYCHVLHVLGEYMGDNCIGRLWTDGCIAVTQ